MQRIDILTKVIKERRSIKPGSMNGEKISDPAIQHLLELADWAPTHGRTEPWRFIIYTGTQLQTFCQQHADLYKAHSDPDKFTTAKYEAMIQQGEKVSHLIIIYMKRQLSQKIPLVEEIAATAAAAEHILLGAQALGIAALWSTGGMTHHDSLKQMLGLADEDMVMGLLYLGYTNEIPAEGKRNIPLTDKISWIR